MARNEEKAQAMLNRFVAAKREANTDDKTKRPYLASECEDLGDCERYRHQIIKEMSKMVSLIQNEGLDEHKVRDLNDAINKLMRERATGSGRSSHWAGLTTSARRPSCWTRTRTRSTMEVRATATTALRRSCRA